MATQAERIAPRKGSLLNDPRFRGLIFQIVVAVVLALVVADIVYNTATNLHKRGIASGFSFLWKGTAGFDIGIRLIPYEMTSTYGRAFLVGLVNTLVVSACSIVLATILGLLIGVLRLSRNWLIAKLAAVYVEIGRNIPLLLQILFWYVGVLQALPGIKQSLSLLGAVFLNNRGLYMPRPDFLEGAWGMLAALVVAVVATVLLRRWAKARQERTGRPFPAMLVGLLLVIALPTLASALAGFPVQWEYPVPKGFNFAGGMVIQPEFVALMVALTLYTAAFIGEIVRSGIESVSHGQTEAAYALGLKPRQTLRLIIIPQAMRVIVPPLTSQYLNITKNSSLAVAIGYPELVSVFAGTVLNQTGQAVETIVITMAVYMVISLVIAMFMNSYNRRIALVER